MGGTERQGLWLEPSGAKAETSLAGPVGTEEFGFHSECEAGRRVMAGALRGGSWPDGDFAVTEFVGPRAK